MSEMKEGVYVHKYFGCLCTFEKDEYLTTTVYGLETDDDTLGSYGFAFIKEMLTDSPECWQYLGEL